MIRRYTLLGTTTADGVPAQLLSTKPAGTLVTHRVDGRDERFELTDTMLYDGTYAAEPVDRYLQG